MFISPNLEQNLGLVGEAQMSDSVIVRPSKEQTDDCGSILGKSRVDGSN